MEMKRSIVPSVEAMLKAKWCQLERLPEELRGEFIFKSLESFADTLGGAGPKDNPGLT